MKILMSTALLLLALIACGSSVRNDLRIECRDAGGEVSVVGSQATCLKDGAVIAKWVEYHDK